MADIVPDADYVAKFNRSAMRPKHVAFPVSASNPSVACTSGVESGSDRVACGRRTARPRSATSGSALSTPTPSAARRMTSGITTRGATPASHRSPTRESPSQSSRRFWWLTLFLTDCLWLQVRHRGWHVAWAGPRRRGCLVHRHSACEARYVPIFKHYFLLSLFFDTSLRFSGVLPIKG